jgi:hypothetical protein
MFVRPVFVIDRAEWTAEQGHPGQVADLEHVIKRLQLFRWKLGALLLRRAVTECDALGEG